MLICETKMLTFNVKVVIIMPKKMNSFSKLVIYQLFGKLCIIFFLKINSCRGCQGFPKRVFQIMIILVCLFLANQSHLTDHFNRRTHLTNLQYILYGVVVCLWFRHKIFRIGPKGLCGDLLLAPKHVQMLNSRE